MSRPRPDIRLLESRVVDQIAAGEVIERPASVVKELVENALDAGATRVTVALEDGGRARIRVEDDGHGMSESEALLAIERHATSKIRDTADLEGVRTLGFRGEALPSVAAVSRFQLVTRPHDEETGTRIRLDAGTLTDVRATGASPGTVVEVRDLFHTLPARRAFLRSAATELSHAVEAVRRIALVRPETAFEVRHGDRVVLRAPVARDLWDRAHAVLGADLDDAAPFADEGPPRCAGWWAPGVHRTTAGEGVHLYVDGRWVRDRVLRNAIHGVFRDRLPAGRSPLLLLDLRTPPGAVDVNVHPTKAEVRFRDPAGLSAHVSALLGRLVGRPPTRLGAVAAPPTALPFVSPAPAARLPALPPGLPPRAEPAPPVAAEPVAPEPVAAEPAAVGPSPVAAPRRIVGLARGRWAVVEGAEGLEVYDAGRLLRRRQAWAASPGPRLVVPVRTTLPAKDVVVLEAAQEALERYGLRYAVLSGTDVVTRALPATLQDAPAAELLRLAIEALRGGADPRQRWGDGLPPAPVSLGALADVPLPDELRVARVALP